MNKTNQTDSQARPSNSPEITRRHFFGECGYGVGKIALAGLLTGALGQARARTHFAPKAKRVIHLFQAGAPSQLELFDNKPKLKQLEGKPLPPSVIGDQRYAFIQRDAAVLGPRFGFARHGQCGAELSDKLPHLAKVVDDIAIIRSMHTDQFNHAPGQIFFNTGFAQPGRPCLGSWLSYGLGSENRDLPGFVVMTPRWSGRRDAQALYNRLWGAGMLPSRHAGVALRPEGDPVLFLQNPAGVDAASRRRMLDALGRINGRLHEQVGDPEIQTRIAQYELAYRMQSSVPELNDLGSEPDSTFAMYGDEARQPGTFAASCLLARRMVERGVRFVQIFHRGWDQHGNLTGDLPRQCRDVDQASWALVQDLKQRGMLEDTLVVWGGEFGRTVYCQGRLTRENYGRDHHPRCF
ncbi:MAG TPA: sulfatase, partial [Verrucomicrobiales bacterium]|nr:sulfatase [Verrucomicrobiales bacterium]